MFQEQYNSMSPMFKEQYIVIIQCSKKYNSKSPMFKEQYIIIIQWKGTTSRRVESLDIRTCREADDLKKKMMFKEQYNNRNPTFKEQYIVIIQCLKNNTIEW